MIVSRCKFNNFQKCLIRSASSRRRKGEVSEVKFPEAKKLVEPWNERKGVWKSSFEYFQPKWSVMGPDTIRFLQTPLDFSPKNIKKWYDRKAEEQDEHNQAFMDDRLEALGPDLAAAHFVVYRGGAVRFYNEKDWVRKKEDGTNTLPQMFVSGLFVEAMDCRGINIRPIGLENILDLSKLRWLSLAGNPLVDDWTLDSVSGSYGDTLQYLDVSNCPKVSHRALSCFYRFRCLDTLVVEGISSSDEFKLACMMLEDIRPRLTIKGIAHDVPKKKTVFDMTETKDDK